uniref:Elongation factor Tu, chloroplastic n=1 Tax=Globisporangium ultimum (strain ATCC 200006 / CBS 805.95 / DAOM BR144) TaxID=431595 RepID=K3WD69_GLOUD
MVDLGLQEQLVRVVRNEYARSPAAPRTTSEHLPEEIEEGNVEYKLKLIDPAPDRLKHLTTQLHWRLNEGKGTAFYEVGVRDNGDPIGIPEELMVKSVCTLARMCQALHAELAIVRFRDGHKSTLKAARMQITRTLLGGDSKKHLRVSVIGSVDSGKSTLIGVLTRGCLDDGNGLARMQVFRHRHEIENGRTSSISEHTIGRLADEGLFIQGSITQDGRFASTDDCDVNAFRGDDDAACDTHSFITFSDLAGHEKYLKITASGLASQFPDYAMLVVDATKGIQPMTREHLKIATALEVSIFVVLTKSDAASVERIQKSIDEVTELLRICCPSKQLSALRNGSQSYSATTTDESVVPLLLVSNLNGDGLDTLQKYLADLKPKRTWSSKDATAAEFQINKAYEIEDTGTIVTGLVQRGTLSVGEIMLLGPDTNGQFVDVTIDSIEVQRKAVQSLSAGETGAVLISFLPVVEMSASHIRKGMMLVHPSVRPMATLQFDAEVHFLADSPTIRENYQAVIHAGQIRQMAKLVRMMSNSPVEEEATPTTTTTTKQFKTICRFEFMYWPEYMRPDLPLVLREGSAHGVGKVVRTVHFSNEHVASVRTC